MFGLEGCNRLQNAYACCGEHEKDLISLTLRTRVRCRPTQGGAAAEKNVQGSIMRKVCLEAVWLPPEHGSDTGNIIGK